MLSHLPRTFLMAAIWAGTIFLLTHSIRLLPLAFLVGVSLPGYLSALVYGGVIKKLIAVQGEM